MRSSNLIRCFTASLVASQPANIKIVFVYINFVFNFGDANIASIDLASQTESEYACMIVARKNKAKMDKNGLRLPNRARVQFLVTSTHADFLIYNNQTLSRMCICM